MPAVSERQRRYFAMCAHGGEADKGCPKGMTKEQMRDFSRKSKKTSNKNYGSTQAKKRRHKGAVSKLMGG